MNSFRTTFSQTQVGGRQACDAVLQDPLFQGGLVAALIALINLQYLSNNFDDSSSRMTDLLGVCMGLVVERKALETKDSLYPRFCLQCLTTLLPQLSTGILLTSFGVFGHIKASRYAEPSAEVCKSKSCTMLWLVSLMQRHSNLLPRSNLMRWAEMNDEMMMMKTILFVACCHVLFWYQKAWDGLQRSRV